MPQAASLLLQALPQVMLLLPLILAGGSVPDRQFYGTINDARTSNLALSDGAILPPPSSSTQDLIGDRVRISPGTLDAGLSPSTGETLLGTQITSAQRTVAGGRTDGYGYHLENINNDTETD